MSKIITINSVDIEAYMKAVENYNKLPKKDRTSWLDLRKGYKNLLMSLFCIKVTMKTLTLIWKLILYR